MVCKRVREGERAEVHDATGGGREQHPPTSTVGITLVSRDWTRGEEVEGLLLATLSYRGAGGGMGGEEGGR